MKLGLSAVLLTCLVSSEVIWSTESHQVQFRARADLIQIDVSVLDRQGHPVVGLTAADFEIREDGRPQRLVGFHEVLLPDPPEVTTTWMREVSPDVATNSLDNHRLFVIVLDDATLELNLAAVRSVREIARGLIDRLGPQDLAAVIFTRDNRHSQDFTADRAKLLAAVDQFSVGFRGSLSGPGGRDDYFFESSIMVLWNLAEYLADIPDRRKAILYIGQGVPVDVAQLAPTLISGGNLGTISRRETQIGLARRMMRVFDRARLANVSVYLFDACGLRASSPFTCRPGLEVEYMQTVAGNTGGRAFVNTNDFQAAMQQTFRETSAYYLLGYVSDAPTAVGSFRRISVRVRRPDVEVRTRSGYYATDPRAPGERAPALETAMAGVLPKRDIQMSAVAAPFGAPGRAEAAVIVSTSLATSGGPPVGSSASDLALLISAFTPEGRPRGSVRTEIRVDVNGTANRELLSRIDLKAGRYQLRIAVTRRDGKSGSVYVDVEVPDFSREDLSLSGPVLGRARLSGTVLNGAAVPAVPLAPSTSRTFARRDSVTAFLRVYQGGRAAVGDVEVLAKIIDSKGAVVVATSQMLPAKAFGGTRNADWLLALPLDRLVSGAYLLDLEASRNSQRLRRQVRFVVEP